MRATLALCRAIVVSCLVASAAGADGVSPASRLTSADSSSEYWDLSARLQAEGASASDEEYYVFARFSISNEGPGDRTAYAIGQVVFPDGRVAAFENGRREGRWSLSPDGLGIEIGSSILDLHAPLWHFEVDKNKKGQKVYLDLPVKPSGARAWSGAPGAYAVDLLQNAAPVAGTLWIRGVVEEPVPVKGLATVSHTSMEVNETEQTLRRIELHAGEGGLGIYLLDVLSPKGDSSHWVVIERDGVVLFETNEVEIETSGKSPETTKDYPIPRRLTIRSERLEGTIELGKLLVRHDPLEIAPQPFRWLLSFVMEPSHSWLEAATALVLDGEPIAARGVVSVFWVNEAR